MIAAEESLALAPTPAADDLLRAARCGFEDKIRTVGNELAVYAKDGTESAFNLGRGIILRLECAHREVDKRLERGDVRRCCEANVK
jgi:hypothetical protein